MKNTLNILAVCAILGALLVGCSPSPEGNGTDGASTNKQSTDVKSSGTATPDAPVGNTSAPAGTDSKAPAGTDTKAPGGDTKAPAGDTNKPADPAASTNK